MPDEKEEVTAKLVHRLGLDGIENLIYGDEPSSNLFTSLTVGAHLRFWPRWMDFYLGNTKRYKKQFPDEKALTAYYGASDTDGWLEEIRKNIRAALAEKPEYLVWHVADCTLEEAWTRQFYYTSKDVLRETAAIYNAVSEEVPETVEVLFENIFWPGLCRLLPSEIDYFFSLLKGSNVGLVLDTGHFMNTNPDLETEADGAEYICAMAEKLGSMKKLFRGMHLSCSLSGKYQKSCTAVPPENMDGETVMMKKCICLLWLLMAVCFCSPAGAETGLYFLSWDMDGDAVCYALEVTTEDGEVLYADDSVWQNEVIFPADIPSEAEEKIFWRVRPFDLYGGPLHGWTEREPFEAVGSFLEREAPLLRPDNHEDRRMKLLYPVYSYVGLPGAKSYEVEVTDSEPENPDGTEPSMYRVWSGTTEIMEIYDDFPRTGVYWWRVRCLDEDGNALGVWSEARRMEMPVDGWETGLFGDSISHGGGRMSFSPSDALYNLGFYLDESTVNLAQSGDTSRRMAERFEADVLPFRLRYLLIMGGTNSLRGGEDPEAVIGDLRYIGDKCRENGIKPIYLTLAPINPDNIKRYFDEDTAPDWKERFSTVNEWIRTQDHIDTAVLFADMDVLSPEYGADGIHIDWKGKFLMGQLINRELPKFKE